MLAHIWRQPCSMCSCLSKCSALVSLICCTALDTPHKALSMPLALPAGCAAAAPRASASTSAPGIASARTLLLALQQAAPTPAAAAVAAQQGSVAGTARALAARLESAANGPVRRCCLPGTFLYTCVAGCMQPLACVHDRLICCDMQTTGCLGCQPILLPHAGCCRRHQRPCECAPCTGHRPCTPADQQQRSAGSGPAVCCWRPSGQACATIRPLCTLC